jgi:putative PIN family toxin of toxin-antitoxin system
VKIVLDSNVIIAAFAVRGLCAELFEVCLLEHEIILSDHILQKVRKNLLRKIHLPPKATDSIISYLRDITEIVDPLEVDDPLSVDKKDRKVLGTAVAANAAFLVTGDRVLLAIKRFRGLKIATPRGLWEFLRRL